jgi:predicted nuclease with TOPRIM domain
MPDGSTMLFEKGELKEVTPAQSPEMDALKKENQDLQNKLAESVEAQNRMKAELDAIKEASNKVIGEFTAFKNQYSKENPIPNTPPKTETSTKALSKQELEKLI